MKRALVFLSMLFLLGATTACATEAVERDDRAASLDLLFQRLQATNDDNEARLIAAAIHQLWARSGRQDVDLMMVRAADELRSGNTDESLAVLDQVVSLAPDYVEGWNLRATTHYMRDEYGEALSDIRVVLALEPRHFGALAGLGQILVDLNEKRQALRVFDAALAINPHLSDIRKERAELTEQMAGIPI